MSKGLPQGVLPGCQRPKVVAAPPPPPPRAKVPAPPRSVRLIGPDNGYGLSRDRAVLGEAFGAAGWDVSALVPGAAAPPVAVQVHLEIPRPELFHAAQRNVLVPNAEWWNPAWNALLRRPGVRVWAKTGDGARVFEGLGAHVVRLGFRSADRQDLAVPRQRQFLHIGGASPNKGTRRLANAWRPEWPQLTIVCSTLRPGPLLPHNVLVRGALPEEELRALQNSCVFHLYPSRYEGFGHAPWEGLSCGAVVLATNGPPFDEHPGAFRLLASVPAAPSPVRLVGFRDVPPEAVAADVAWALSLSPESLAERQAAARAAWEQGAAAFAERARAAIAELEAPAPAATVSLSPLSSRLGELPPLAYVGRVNCVTGYGAAARHQVHVLRRHGLRLQIVDSGSACSPDPRGLDPFVQAARRSDEGAEAPQGTILHVAPNHLPPFRHLPRPHILVSVWETTRLPAEWVQVANGCDQVWCATAWQRAVYRDSGVRPELLRLVPFALDPELYPASPAPRAPDGRTVFGSVFQWTARKNPEALIGAYLHAFGGDEPVLLRLKSYEGDSPSSSVQKHVAELVRSFRGRGKPPAIEVLSQPLASDGMATFYAGLDCYVSAHRGEGFGLPIAEALLSGRPVIAPSWSAPAEYGAGLFRSVGYTLEPPRGMDWQPFYTVDQLWAHADVADLAAAMREARAGRLVCDVEEVRARFSDLCQRAGEAAAAALREVLA